MSVRVPAPGRIALLIGLGVITAFAMLVRIPTIAEPLGIDQGVFASAARGLSHGQMLYRDLWDQKPPGIYLTYLSAFRVFGWTAASVAWVDLLATACTAALLFVIVRRLESALTGAVAAALYAALTIPSWLYHAGGILERSVAETFIVVCVAIAAWCAVRLARRFTMVMAIGLGAAVGAAIVFKPNAGLYLPALLVWVACYQVAAPADGSWWTRMLRLAVGAGLGVLLLPLAMLAWFGSHHVLADARLALIDFNRMYLAEGFSFRTVAVAFKNAVGFRVKTDTDPLWVLGSIGVLIAAWDLARRRRLDPVPALAIAWGGGAALVIFANGARMYNTYFIQTLAPLAMLSAWVVTMSMRAQGARRWVGAIAVALLLVIVARKHYVGVVYEQTRADVNQLLGRTDRATYLQSFGKYGNGHGYSARANEELDNYIRDHTTSADTIFFFGMNDSGVYFATDRLPAQRFLRVNFFVPSNFPDPSFQIASVVNELAARRPAFLIFEQLDPHSLPGPAVNALQEQPDVVRLLASYRLTARFQDFTVYRRAE